jgi:hypothetical protein
MKARALIVAGCLLAFGIAACTDDTVDETGNADSLAIDTVATPAVPDTASRDTMVLKDTDSITPADTAKSSSSKSSSSKSTSAGKKTSGKSTPSTNTEAESSTRRPVEGSQTESKPRRSTTDGGSSSGGSVENTTSGGTESKPRR